MINKLPLIVYPHSPNMTPKMYETAGFIIHLQALGFKIKEILTPEGEPYAYDNGLKKIWGKEDIIIIESDVVPTVELILELANCQHDICAATNKIVNHKGERSGFRFLDPKGIVQGMTLEEVKNHKFCDYAGLACTKISKFVQEKYYNSFMANRYYWKYMDYFLWEDMKPRKHIHIHHTLCKHNHVYGEPKPLVKNDPKDFEKIGQYQDLELYIKKGGNPEQVYLYCPHELDEDGSIMGIGYNCLKCFRNAEDFIVNNKPFPAVVYPRVKRSID